MSKNLLGEYIAELTDFTANGSFADLRENVKYYNEYNYAALVRTTDLDKYNFQPEVFTDKNGYEFLVKSRLFGGEIIVANVGSVGKVFKVPNYSLPMTLGPNAYLVRFDKDKIDQEYAYQFLISDFFKTELYRKIGSTTLQAINKDNFRSIELFVPNDINNQQRIAKILSTCDAVIEKTQAAIAKYKAIKQGMLQDLFTRGIDLNTNKLRPRYQDAPHLYKENKLGWIPREWEDKELGDVGEVRMCRRVFNYETSDQGDIPFFKIGTFGKQPDAYISKELYDSYRQQFSFPNKGDILISAAGTIGRTIIYDGSPAYFQDSNIIWIENNGDLVSYEYLYQVFQIVEYKTEGGTIQRLYNSILKSALFPCPPKPEQQLITERLNAIDNKLQTEQTYLQKMQSLKKGLMEDLLCGKVKVSESEFSELKNEQNDI